MKKILTIWIIFFVATAFLFANEAENDQNDNDQDNKIEAVEKNEEITQKDKTPEEGADTIESEQGYNLKLRTLEEKINSLKDKIFRSKQRLAVLQETVLSGTIAGSRATIVHKNKVGGAFRLVSAIIYLDDAPVYKRVNAPDELKKEEIVAFEGSIVPGPHHVSVYYIFEGKGYGLFSYMKGYKFKIQSGYSFNVEEGNLVEIDLSPGDRGSSYNLDNRLFNSFNVSKKMFEGKTESEENTER